MTTDSRSGGKLPAWSTRESTPGTRVDSGPFLGIVKNNVDPARLGRVQVFIPDLGGNELEPSNWYTISYASPFAGSTIGDPGNSDSGTFGTEQQTYGFWAVPPDLNVYVLVTFIMGDPTRGFFFACIPNTPVQGMTPAISRAINNTNVIIPDGFEGRVDDNSYLPVTELNTSTSGTSYSETASDFLTKPRLIHPYQANIVINQGLDMDPIRGTVTSSSQRDAPSRVFGFSTPGRTAPDEIEKFPDLKTRIADGSLSIIEFENYWKGRKGGHSFVMDDGDIFGDSNLVRLRTAGGHQILMHDTENLMYIVNNKGTAWIELTEEGSINVFSGDSLNIRASMDMNFHADGNVNINAGDTINMYAGSTIRSQTKIQLTTADTLYNLNAGKVGIRSGGSLDMRALNGSWENAGLLALKSGKGTWETSGELSLYSSTGGWKTTDELKLVGSQIYFNTAGKTPTAPAEPTQPEINPSFEMYNQINARYDYESEYWYQAKKDFASIAPFTPTHEPWDRKTGTLKRNDGTVNSPIPQKKPKG